MLIFISYKTEDRPFAAKLRQHLVDNGCDVWMDVHDIPSGAYWPDEIDSALRKCNIVIGVMSPRSIESRNVKNEWDWAILNDKRLILVMQEKCYVPMNYISITYIDFASDFDIGLTRLLHSIGIENTKQVPSKVSSGDAHSADQSSLIQALQPSSSEPVTRIISQTRQTVTVDIVILSSGDRYTVEIPLDSPVGLIVRELVSQLGLPQKFENGVQVVYDLYSKTQGTKLDSNLTFRQNNVRENDTLSFHINMVAG